MSNTDPISPETCSTHVNQLGFNLTLFSNNRVLRYNRVCRLALSDKANNIIDLSPEFRRILNAYLLYWDSYCRLLFLMKCKQARHASCNET